MSPESVVNLQKRWACQQTPKYYHGKRMWRKTLKLRILSRKWKLFKLIERKMT
jgi:hypothetical protein